MDPQTNSPDPAMLLVVGRTRVGKGEFISTASRLLNDSELSDIIRNGPLSHTSEPQGHVMPLDGKDIKMVDTVGFDDSGGTDIPERTLLHFLEETGKADFYPPLVILQSLAGSEKNLFEKMCAVFSEVVVAFRMNNTLHLGTYQTDIATVCAATPRHVFPLQEFNPANLDNGASRQCYDDCVSAILDFYKTLTPSRKKLDYTSPLFDGTPETRLFRIDTKYETISSEIPVTEPEIRTIPVFKKVTLVDGGHFEETNSSVRRDLGAGFSACTTASGFLRAATVIPKLTAIPKLTMALSLANPIASALVMTGAGLGGAALLSKKEKWIQNVKEVMVEDGVKEEEVNVRYIVKKKIRRKYQKKVWEMWKVLHGEIKIFIEYKEDDEWEQVGDDELLDYTKTEMPPDLPKGKLSEDLPEGEEMSSEEDELMPFKRMWLDPKIKMC